jgi:hypothetical protein
MSNVNLWDFDENEAREYVKVPQWIEQNITIYDVESICEGGCSSGAYMPAVTYHEANRTMAAFGDEVLEYLDDSFGELPEIPSSSSWSGIAVFFLSAAVEIWANSVRDEIIENIESEIENQNEN